MIKRSDLILITGILAASAVVFAVNTALLEPGATVKVVAGRDVYGIYELTEDRELRIEAGGDFNVIEVSGGTAKMKEASCANGDCLRQHAAGMAGQSIVCLPNKILITIEGYNENDIDSVAY